MKKITILLVAIILLLSTNSLGFETALLSYNDVNSAVFQEIAEIKGKILVVDKIIGDRHVKYWQHTIDGFLVKNDSILLHSDVESGDVIEYVKTWTDVEPISPIYNEEMFEPANYFWKQKVVFLDEDDCRFFYTFNFNLEYPIFCWEVRHTDGTTILYDFSGNEIGHGVTVPSSGCTLRGYGDPLWNFWRDNAKKWFDVWCGYVYCKERPTVNEISNYISRPRVEYFYVIAHSGGLPTRFSANDEGIFYTADQLHEDMLDRNPIKLAILCCCSAMVDTGPGTLSYEFRKGQMDDTVTIGYFNMGQCPGWPYDVYDWQEFMFEKMNDTANYTMKGAFDLACAEYPSVADYVKFVGDEDIKIQAAVDLSSQSEESTIEINAAETGCEYFGVSQFIQSESTENLYQMTDLIKTIVESTNK